MDFRNEGIISFVGNILPILYGTRTRSTSWINFMGHHEQHWLIQKEALSILFYKRYVDDIFCMLKTLEPEIILDFLKHQT